MNPLPMTAHRRGGPSAAIAAMCASTTRRHRNWMLGVYVTLLLCACLLGIFVPGERSRSDGLALFVLLANFSLWAGWFARLLLLQRHAASLHAPGIANAVRAAIASAAVITIVLPAGILLALGVPAPTAFGAAALGVLAGLLFALMPWPAAVGLMMLPAAARALSPYLPPLTPPWQAAAAALGVLVLIACWRSLLRSSDPASIPTWRRPAMLYSPAGMVAWTDPQSIVTSDTPRVHEGWLVAMPRPRFASPHNPDAAIAAVMAGPLGYVAPRVAARQWGLTALIVVAVLLTPFRGDATMLRDAVLIGGVVGLLGGGWTLAMRLERQRQRVSGELVELALLPGLGDPAVASARLLRGIMVRLGQLMLFASAGVLLLVWIRDMTGAHVALLIGMLAGIGAASVLLCAIALDGRSIATARMFLVMLPMLGASFGTTITIGTPTDPHLLAWTTIWTGLTLAYLAAALVPLRRFRSRPHAFLLD